MTGRLFQKLRNAHLGFREQSLPPLLGDTLTFKLTRIGPSLQDLHNIYQPHLENKYDKFPFLVDREIWDWLYYRDLHMASKIVCHWEVPSNVLIRENKYGKWVSTQSKKCIKDGKWCLIQIICKWCGENKIDFHSVIEAIHSQGKAVHHTTIWVFCSYVWISIPLCHVLRCFLIKSALIMLSKPWWLCQYEQVKVRLGISLAVR